MVSSSTTRVAPLAKLHRALGVDLVAHGDDGREVVVLGVVGLAVGGSYSKISNNCVLLELAVLEHLLQVVVDGRDLHVVELRHHLLAEPHVLVGVERLDASRAAGRHEGQILGRRGASEGRDQLLLAGHAASLDCEVPAEFPSSVGNPTSARREVSPLKPTKSTEVAGSRRVSLDLACMGDVCRRGACFSMVVVLGERAAGRAALLLELVEPGANAAIVR